MVSGVKKKKKRCDLLLVHCCRREDGHLVDQLGDGCDAEPPAASVYERV